MIYMLIGKYYDIRIRADSVEEAFVSECYEFLHTDVGKVSDAFGSKIIEGWPNPDFLSWEVVALNPTDQSREVLYTHKFRS